MNTDLKGFEVIPSLKFLEVLFAMDKIPMVDFSAMSSLKETPEDCLSAEIKLLADEIYQAFSTVGFVYIKNHGISQAKVTASLFSTRILLMIWHIMSRGLFSIPGKGGDSHIKRTGMGCSSEFEVPRSCFVGMARKFFHP